MDSFLYMFIWVVLVRFRMLCKNKVRNKNVMKLNVVCLDIGKELGGG